MYIITRRIKTDAPAINIVVVSCLHIGAKHQDTARAEYIRNYILSDETNYAIDLGDTTENALRGSPGAAVYTQTLSIQDQIQAAVDYWAPVAKQNKLLYKHAGNHGDRTLKETGISLDEIISDKIGVPFAGWDALVTIKVGKQSYVIHSCHGKRNGRGPSGAIRACIAQAERAQAEIYLRGHHHTTTLCYDQVATPQGLIKRGFGVTGSFLRWDGSYAEQSEYNPAYIGCLQLTLYKDKHDFELKII